MCVRELSVGRWLSLGLCVEDFHDLAGQSQG